MTETLSQAAVSGYARVTLRLEARLTSADESATAWRAGGQCNELIDRIAARAPVAGV
jgi:hypothetical protein